MFIASAIRRLARTQRLSARLLRALLLCGCFLAQAVYAQQLAEIPALTSPVVDMTGTLSTAEKAQLEQQALAMQQHKGSQLQILIVPTTQPEDIAAYSQRVFDQWKLGRKGIDDAVLVVVAKDDHRARIHTGYGLEGAIPDITAGRVIQEYMVPKFRAGDYAGGIVDATAALTKLIDGEALPEPMAPQFGQGNGQAPWPTGIFLGLFASFFARSVFGWLPKLLRMVAVALAAGAVAWLFTSSLLAVAIAALIGFMIGAATASAGRYAGHSGWGGFGGGSGGSWGGGSSGGGGWSGGGGMSGGGGASGSW